MVQSVYQHVTTLSKQLSPSLTPEKVVEIIQKNLLSSSNVVETLLTEEETSLAEHLYLTKYSQDSWNYSK